MQTGFYGDNSLPHSAGVRGQYMNTGSRDVGPDTSLHNPYLRYKKQQQEQYQLASSQAAPAASSNSAEQKA